MVGSLDVASDRRALDIRLLPYQPFAVGIVGSKSISNEPVEVFVTNASHSLYLVDL